MKKKILFAVGFLFCLNSLFFNNSYAAFTKINGLNSSSFYFVQTSPFDDNLVYTASSTKLFKSTDGAKTWSQIFTVKGEGNTITHIFVDKFRFDKLYLAEKDGLFLIKANNTQRFYQATPNEYIYFVTKYKGKIYLGTNKGVYYSYEDIVKWARFSGLPQDIEVYWIEFGPKKTYLATNYGVYVIRRKTNNIRRTFISRRLQTNESSSASQGEDNEQYLKPKIVKKDIFSENIVYLGTTQGLFVSYDRGMNWEKIDVGELVGIDIRYICQKDNDKSSVYLATAKGIIKLNRFTHTLDYIFEGLPTNSIRWLDFNKKGILLAASSKGLFENKFFDENYRLAPLGNEPSIQEIQEAALKYNEVSPDKIRRWRRALKYRALLPTVSLNYDKSIYGTAGGASYDGKAFVGPRDWGLSLSWDAANLVWNSYEDDVDTRSRLNTQLRLDILDEVNRVYFERLRLVREIMDNSLPQKDIIRKKLRIKELEAILDGYTGGYFSSRLKKLRE